MIDKPIYDVCLKCDKEKLGYYTGDYDNPVFICNDCNKEE